MKRLIFRLSSLGDLILSQSILEPPFTGETHWVVAKEFEGLLLGNPKVAKVWSFDRRATGGFVAWLRFLAQLRRENFTEVLDAHSTLRTQIARIYFRIFSPETQWKQISKERAKRIGYEVMKRLWPAHLRPTHFSKKCALLANGYGNERPNLRWILDSGAEKKLEVRRIAVVPASAWSGKEWPIGKYLEWIKLHREKNPNDEILLLGTKSDRSAVELRSRLLESGIGFTDGVGKYPFRELGQILATCTLVIGADTGLLHFAEGLGVPVVTLFGPTRSDFGFGPLDERSRPLHSGLWCSPCSKDGTLCFRPINRYACLKNLKVRSVEAAVKEIRGTPPKAGATS